MCSCTNKDRNSVSVWYHISQTLPLHSSPFLTRCIFPRDFHPAFTNTNSLSTMNGDSPLKILKQLMRTGISTTSSTLRNMSNRTISIYKSLTLDQYRRPSAALEKKLIPSTISSSIDSISIRILAILPRLANRIQTSNHPHRDTTHRSCKTISLDSLNPAS